MSERRSSRSEEIREPVSAVPPQAKLIFRAIEDRFGFVPPFFLPAAHQPEVLANLWHQTQTAYVDNSLPAVFKERLAAYLGRYCAVPYCLMCHSCSLRPLGLRSDEILSLLRTPLASDEQVSSAADLLRAASPLEALEVSPELDNALIVLAGAVYLQGESSSLARSVLRAALGLERYNLLVVFVSYNKTCHYWMEAHPDVSYVADPRYLANFPAIAKEAPEVAELFADDELARRRKDPTTLSETVAARASEAERSMRLMEIRAEVVVEMLRDRAGQADAAELRRSAEFAHELLAVVSHDLRNPLSAVLMAATMIIQDVPSGPVAGYAARIVRSTQRATRLVGDLLDFSQMKLGGGIPITLAPTRLELLVRQVADELGTAHPERLIVVNAEGDGTGHWDADRLAQVISNLLSNALAHSPPTESVFVSTRGDAERVSLEVRNANLYGPIPDELVPFLFDPFKRGSHRHFKTKSVGLGLYIVDHIVKRHNGQVTFRSDAGGTSFTVTLPRVTSV